MKTKNSFKITRECKDMDMSLGYQPIAFAQRSAQRPHYPSARRFELYKSAHTIQEARKLGASSRDLRRDLCDGVIVQLVQGKDMEIPLEHQPIAFVQQSVRRPGGPSDRRFQLYKSARTIHEARQLGATSRDLHHELRNGVLVPGKRLDELGIVTAIRLFAPADSEPITFAPNPKKPGYAAYARYERYSRAKTMLQAKKLGIWPGDIAHDIRSGYMGTSLTPFAAMGFKKYRAAKGGVKPPGSSPVAKRKRTAKTATAVRSATTGVKKVGGKRPLQKKSSLAKAWSASIKAPPLAWTKLHGWV